MDSRSDSAASRRLFAKSKKNLAAVIPIHRNFDADARIGAISTTSLHKFVAKNILNIAKTI
jgi:hypothetical protein